MKDYLKLFTGIILAGSLYVPFLLLLLIEV